MTHLHRLMHCSLCFAALGLVLACSAGDEESGGPAGNTWADNTASGGTPWTDGAGGQAVDNAGGLTNVGGSPGAGGTLGPDGTGGAVDSTGGALGVGGALGTGGALGVAGDTGVGGDVGSLGGAGGAYGGSAGMPSGGSGGTPSGGSSGMPSGGSGGTPSGGSGGMPSGGSGGTPSGGSGGASTGGTGGSGTGGAGGGSGGGSGGSSDPGTGGTATGTGGAPPVSELVGWASVADCGANGTTGGGDVAPITVTDGAALKEAMNSSDPMVICVSGTIQTPGNFSGRHNKTLIGINNAEIVGGSGLVGCTNIIVKNIRFRDGPNDSFGLSGSACVWIDHCEFVDGTDGNLDIVNGTDFVTVSWSRFYYTRGHDHMLAVLVGNTQPHEGDVGRENITFHHNWWGAGVKSRKPRVRYGQVHVFNNYYHYTPVAGDGGDDYDIGAGFESKLLVENNYFDGSSEPITWMSDEGTAEVVERNNEFVNAGGVVTRGSAFVPPYPYEHVMEAASQVRDSVTASAGVQ